MGTSAGASFASVWITWWLGDAVGIALVTPLLVMWSRPSPARWTWVRVFEMTAVLVAVAVAAWLVFNGLPRGLRAYLFPSMAVPVLLWPAFRLGARETAAAAVLLSGIAILATLGGTGPFVRDSLNESLLAAQAFAGIWMMAMLAVSIEVETRERAEAGTRALNETLERRVALRTEEVTRMQDRLLEAQRVAHVGSWERDVASDKIWWSDELFRIFDANPADLTYESYLTLLHPDDRAMVESLLGKALADGRPFSFEHRLIRRDGTVRAIQADGHVVLNESGAPLRMVGTARDVTELRHAEDERIERIREQAARLEAEDANRAKDEFLATLSHELRTPLNAALGWTHMLRDVLEDPEARRRAIDAITRNLHAQARLVSDMMDVSHITLRTLRLERAPVDMREVIRVAIESARNSATARRITFESDLPASPVYVTGDDGRLQQVVWNLLSNGAKFSSEGGLVHVSLCVEADVVRLVVCDDGPGIDELFLPHLFERFKQADSSVTREHGGLGLGLAIARHLVEAHGGAISAANRPEGGAAFTVRLPLAPASVTG
jgi:PAS domain S-box-containing protein